ncbi:MAG TPA: 2OG-Fe(II) oxygenase family protein [Allosphingosinicella sp.]|uniref:2OG-Fe(II) oxygenase n=1 Tax=Allosphingosinicella sp. TaxID=2823234 RepID=UPI002F275F52
MSRPAALFQLSPALDRRALAERFAADQRIQIRDVLTPGTATEVQRVLAQHTPWAVAWQAGRDGPHVIRREQLQRLTGAENEAIGQKIRAAIQGDDYAFSYSSYPMLDAYLARWNPGGPHDLLLEYLNAPEFLDFIRQVTGIPELLKADAQATLYAPGQFLAEHDDHGGEEGRRVAYVLNMTLGKWRQDWGGYLLFFDDDGDIVAGFRPRFNALNLFTVPQRHNVSYVPPFSPVGRYAITGWFRDR